MTPGIETIDLIVNNLDDGDHPLHLHGHTFWIVGSGVGRYIYPESEFSTSHPMYDLKSDNPMRRDTVVLPAYSFVVLRFITDNPGLWAFHCHIAWYVYYTPPSHIFYGERAHVLL
jgi:FtsP/CotA-like multicopper oxidase with cupredoxin domain